MCARSNPPALAAAQPTSRTRVRACGCTCVAVIGALLLLSGRQRGRSPKLIHTLPQYGVSVFLHQRMQIPRALMSLGVYTMCDD